MKRAKKMFTFTFAVAVAFAFVAIASASEFVTLNYNSSHRITKNNLGNFTTTMYATSLKNQPTIETQAGRQMFNLIWHDSGKNVTTVMKTGTTYYATWTANGKYNTRATWKNLSNNTTFSGNLDLF